VDSSGMSTRRVSSILGWGVSGGWDTSWSGQYDGYVVKFSRRVHICVHVPGRNNVDYGFGS